MADSTANGSGSREQDQPEVERMLALLLQQARQHSLLLLDPAGKILAWLAGAEEMFGYTADEILGDHSSRLFTPEDNLLGLAEHEIETARESGVAEDDRWQLRKDGTRIWVTGVLYRLLDEEGRLVGY